MTLHFKDWDDTLDDDNHPRGMANTLAEQVAAMSEVKAALVAAGHHWLASEVEQALGNIMDVARTLWRNETTDHPPADAFDTPVSNDLLVVHNPDVSARLQEMLRVQRAGGDWREWARQNPVT